MWGLARSAACLHTADSFNPFFLHFFHVYSYSIVFDPILYPHLALPLNIPEFLHITTVRKHPITNFTLSHQPHQTSNNSLGLYPNKAYFFPTRPMVVKLHLRGSFTGPSICDLRALVLHTISIASMLLWFKHLSV